MRWRLLAALCAAELRLETGVAVEVILDGAPRTLRARIDEDPAKAAAAFCGAISLDCEDRVAAAIRAEQAAVLVRTGRAPPPEVPRRVPAPPRHPPPKEPAALETTATIAVPIVVDGRSFYVEAALGEAPHAAAARFCNAHDVRPRDCNVLSRALAEKQEAALGGRRAADALIADRARSALAPEASWGDHLFTGDDIAPPVDGGAGSSAEVGLPVDDGGAGSSAEVLTSVDYSVRVPPALRVSFRGRISEVVVERYLGETADQAVGRACRAARATADECADLGSAFACKVTPSAKCEAAQERMDAEPARAERLRRLSTGAALLGAVAIAYFQHRAAAGV